MTNKSSASCSLAGTPVACSSGWRWSDSSTEPPIGSIIWRRSWQRARRSCTPRYQDPTKSPALNFGGQDNLHFQVRDEGRPRRHPRGCGVFCPHASSTIPRARRTSATRTPSAARARPCLAAAARQRARLVARALGRGLGPVRQGLGVHGSRRRPGQRTFPWDVRAARELVM